MVEKASPENKELIEKQLKVLFDYENLADIMNKLLKINLIFCVSIIKKIKIIY